MYWCYSRCLLSGSRIPLVLVGSSNLFITEYFRFHSSSSIFVSSDIVSLGFDQSNWMTLRVWNGRSRKSWLAKCKSPIYWFSKKPFLLVSADCEKRWYGNSNDNSIIDLSLRTHDNRCAVSRHPWCGFERMETRYSRSLTCNRWGNNKEYICLILNSNKSLN